MNDRLLRVPQSKLTHYERLGVSPQADAEALRQAFRRLSKTLHPDTTTRPATEASRDFRLLREAYDLLADPQRRRRYDEQLQLERRTAEHRPFHPRGSLPPAAGMASASGAPSPVVSGLPCCCWGWRCC